MVQEYLKERGYESVASGGEIIIAPHHAQVVVGVSVREIIHIMPILLHMAYITQYSVIFVLSGILCAKKNWRFKNLCLPLLAQH